MSDDRDDDQSPDHGGGPPGDGDPTHGDADRERRRPYERVDDDRIVRTAAGAAEDLVFSRFDTTAVEDLDVTVTFEDGILEVDVYLHVPEPGIADPERVADDAALAARRAVDELLADEGTEPGD